MKTNKEDVAFIDRAYQSKCNDEWEHFHGITIETTDNPGWLATLDWTAEVQWEKIMQGLEREFRSRGGLEYRCDKEGNKLRVFCTTLSALLERVARILEQTDERLPNHEKPIEIADPETSLIYYNYRYENPLDGK